MTLHNTCDLTRRPIISSSYVFEGQLRAVHKCPGVGVPFAGVCPGRNPLHGLLGVSLFSTALACPNGFSGERSSRDEAESPKP